MSHRVVVIGGGFGGLNAIQALRRADVEITLIDRRNFHLFQPLSYQVATGALSPGEVAYPLRAIFKSDRTCGSCSRRWPGSTSTPAKYTSRRHPAWRRRPIRWATTR